MKIYEIKDILNAEVLTGENRMDQTVAAGGGADLMDDVLTAVAEGGSPADRPDQRTGASNGQNRRRGPDRFCSRQKNPKKSILELAESYNLPMLSTRFSLFVASGRLYMNGLRGLDGSW